MGAVLGVCSDYGQFLFSQLVRLVQYLCRYEYLAQVVQKSCYVDYLALLVRKTEDIGYGTAETSSPPLVTGYILIPHLYHHRDGLDGAIHSPFQFLHGLPELCVFISALGYVPMDAPIATEGPLVIKKGSP